MKYLYEILVGPGIRYECVAEDVLHLKKTDMVIVQCERYEDCGTIVRCRDQEPVDDLRLTADVNDGEKGRRIQGAVMPLVVRHCTLVDKGKIHENEVREKGMLRAVQQKIHDHKLDMKVVNVHFVFDKSLLVVQFSAEGRIDFRELLRDLSRDLHARVELRQIGVRDETAVQGGLGSCGRRFCCATFLRDFQSINVRLAKEQGLSLNPANISGACGRLKCCLRYEADGYKKMRAGMPKAGTLCDTPDGPGKVIEVLPLAGRVRVVLMNTAGNGPSRPTEYPVADIKAKAPPPGTGPRPPAAPAPQGEDEEA